MITAAFPLAGVSSDVMQPHSAMITAFSYNHEFLTKAAPALA